MGDKFTEDTKLAEVMKTPGSNKILSKYKLPCLHCPMAAYEAGVLKLKEISSMYGIDLKGMLEELNKI